jgi:hypothetical protein
MDAKHISLHKEIPLAASNRDAGGIESAGRP